MDARIKLAAALAATFAVGAAPTFAGDVVKYPPEPHHYIPAERTYYYVPAERTYYYAPDTTTYNAPPLASYYDQPVVTTRIYEATRNEPQETRDTTDRRIENGVREVRNNERVTRP